MQHVRLSQHIQAEHKANLSNSSIIENANSPCVNCLANKISVCAGLVTSSDAALHRDRKNGVTSFGQEYPPRRAIVHQREVSDYVPFICKGWAITVMVRPNGKRLLLSVLLPGEPASPNYILEACEGRVVEAVSATYSRKFNREEFRAALFAQPEGLSFLAASMAKEREATDDQHIDLSARSAEARVGRFLVAMVSRLQGVKTHQGIEYSFPLRQSHIAEATGLTTVHVCKVLARLKSMKLIELHARVLRVIDLSALRRIAEQ